MRLSKVILAAALLLLPLLCRAQKAIFDNYSEMKGVSSVYISKAMIEMNPDVFAKDVYIGKVSGKLECVQILSTMNNDIKKELRKDIHSLVQSSKYELLMKQKGSVSGSEFYINKKGDKVKELIMVIDGDTSLKFVYLEGEMSLKDIQNIMMYHSMNTGDNAYYIFDNTFNLADMNVLTNPNKLEELKEIAKLKGSEYLQKNIGFEIGKRIEKGIETLEKRWDEMK